MLRLRDVGVVDILRELVDSRSTQAVAGQVDLRVRVLVVDRLYEGRELLIVLAAA
jgi:hypothetical protein